MLRGCGGGVRGLGFRIGGCGLRSHFGLQFNHFHAHRIPHSPPISGRKRFQPESPCFCGRLRYLRVVFLASHSTKQFGCVSARIPLAEVNLVARKMFHEITHAGSKASPTGSRRNLLLTSETSPFVLLLTPGVPGL